ncbi:LysE family translocator [Pseudohalocynthiibacter aestuariivivens]|jgi:homoserine/homoserine lactone efflux protein|uniref:LysE family translocator n=1 Tax=Pseudohalocynthiibacter aestuariivivens TaxID=1591409 RepID=A0ABV5JFM3_9RHOB|nr:MULTISPECIES: LysE family translocator [Pseudohalocynthiibacter]MBS9717985.1 LysE family translocator [Pseudohalocynthiibacter aestuariivivens]MCK0103157.1 LysE family translocator [Pseudohalocynthiibacter sp. F2068]
MSFQAWTIFALFWVVFVVTPGPNAVNCISNGMALGFRRALPGVAAILCQAVLFLVLSALGITALIAASPTAFFWVKMLGAGFLIYLGIRSWMNAGQPVTADGRPARSVFWKAFLIATINAKSVAGYLAAFSQFVQPDVPIWDQMMWIMPTALTITALSYCSYTALGSGLGRLAIGAVLNVWFRRTMAACFIVYGIFLGTATAPQLGRG